MASNGSRPAAQDDGGNESLQTVPDVCLDAIQAARDRLILTSETRDLASDYDHLLRGALKAARSGDFDSIASLPDQLGALNEKAAALLDRSSRAAFSAPAEECERLAE